MQTAITRHVKKQDIAESHRPGMYTSVRISICYYSYYDPIVYTQKFTGDMRGLKETEHLEMKTAITELKRMWVGITADWTSQEQKRASPIGKRASMSIPVNGKKTALLSF